MYYQMAFKSRKKVSSFLEMEHYAFMQSLSSLIFFKKCFHYKLPTFWVLPSYGIKAKIMYLHERKSRGGKVCKWHETSVWLSTQWLTRVT